MENATKGLMIAGAILIAIVLIGIGVALVSGAQGFLDSSTTEMDSMERTAFNSKIEQYEGKQSGANIKTLLTNLNSVNMDLTAKENYAERGIGVILTDGTNELEIDPKVEYTSELSKNVTTARAKINTGKTYNVLLDYDGSTGLVSNVTITVNSTSNP